MTARTVRLLKYFSGVATYTKSFALPKGVRPGSPLLLDLGQVGDLAEVHVNGKLVGTAWHAPYCLDIGTALQAGRLPCRRAAASFGADRSGADDDDEQSRALMLSHATASKRFAPNGLFVGPDASIARVYVVNAAKHGQALDG